MLPIRLDHTSRSPLSVFYFVGSGRGGVVKHDVVAVRGPMFEPLLRPLYLLIAFTLVVGVALMVTTGFSITIETFSIAALPAFLIIAGMLARRILLYRVADCLEGGALLYQQSIVMLIVLYPVAALSGSYADDWLVAGDRALAFDWVAYLDFCRPYTRELLFAYKSFGVQPAILVLALALTGRRERLITLITAAFVGLMIVGLIFPFAPAVAPLTYFDIQPADYPELKGTGPWDFLVILNGIRNGSERVLSPELFTGMISFPSYHSTMAFLFAWAAWSVKWLRWPMLVLNLALLASTPVIGNHYLVDTLAGVAVGVIALALSRRLVCRKSNANT